MRRQWLVSLSTAFFGVVLITLNGCGAPSPVWRATSEYIDPTQEAALACVNTHRKKRSDCLGRAELQKRRCKSEALAAANDRLETELIAYQERLADAKEEAANVKGNMDRQYSDEMLAYDQCKARADKQRNQEEARRRTAEAKGQLYVPPLNYGMGYGSYCQKPLRPNAYNVQAQQMAVIQRIAGSEPKLRDYYDDSHCAIFAENCKEEFDQAYVACGGIININQVCIQNCPE